MTRISSMVLPFLLVVGLAAQSHDDLAMRCSTPPTSLRADGELVQPMSKEEFTRLRNAPHGAKRVGKHRLEVDWTGGKRTFTDKPPYDEPLDGIRWAYCGYGAKLGVHLLLKQDQWLFTGALLDDRTGSLLPGGEAILFSPDLRYYLAYEQPDGQDGETIKLYKRNGAVVWKGYNGILSVDGKSVVANFENMRWDNHNRLRAAIHLDGGKTVTVTLTRGGDTGWEWLPNVQR